MDLLKNILKMALNVRETIRKHHMKLELLGFDQQREKVKFHSSLKMRKN
ncbi:hypothetical protein KDU71_02420 [Carboxylicivirga sediminis]|uniref:Uncharacterized protein n=1 Tax=Carboxylicivirga sediminis TaxID=2006564 RepID=A0A941F0X1_9BACT|nr:hypothetical protein [Carboxylicivirga sediminis]MBR8534399.1 hypothetical protein [Carboxylicivirga sediminis]